MTFPKKKKKKKKKKPDVGLIEVGEGAVLDELLGREESLTLDNNINLGYLLQFFFVFVVYLVIIILN